MPSSPSAESSSPHPSLLKPYILLVQRVVEQPQADGDKAERAERHYN